MAVAPGPILQVYAYSVVLYSVELHELELRHAEWYTEQALHVFVNPGLID